MENKSTPKGVRVSHIPNSGVFTTQGNFRSYRKSLTAIAASLALAAVALPASAANWWTQKPAISVGPTVINVRNMGAMGNGVTDDTAAIQAAIDALPSSGGTVIVPNGTYMINALKGISLRSHTRLSLWGNAYLTAIPNNAQRYWIVKAWNVNNVEIVGGNFVGERAKHQGTAGEWGYGINIQGSTSVYVHDTTISNSWGDGILVGATGWGSSAVLSRDVTLVRVKCKNNRRQGLTIAPSTQVYVYSSSFTGSNGTAPQAGIDIEPQTQGSTQQVRIEGTVMSDNAGNGLEVHNNVSGVVLTTSKAENNKGFGVYDNGGNNFQITNSLLSTNYLFGVDIAGYTHDVQINNNSINYNGASWFYAHNQSIFSAGWVPRDVTVAGTATNVSQSNNKVSPLK